MVHAAGEHALATYGIEVLVIAADADGDAIRIYRRLGFADAERHNTLRAASRATGPDPRRAGAPPLGCEP